MIFIFMNVNKMGGITFKFARVNTIHGDLVMAKHSNNIMVITLNLALGMKLPMVASNTKVHTSVSGQSGVLGELIALT